MSAPVLCPSAPSGTHRKALLTLWSTEPTRCMTNLKTPSSRRVCVECQRTDCSSHCLRRHCELFFFDRLHACRLRVCVVLSSSGLRDSRAPSTLGTDSCYAMRDWQVLCLVKFPNNDELPPEHGDDDSRAASCHLIQYPLDPSKKDARKNAVATSRAPMLDFLCAVIVRISLTVPASIACAGSSPLVLWHEVPTRNSDLLLLRRFLDIPSA